MENGNNITHDIEIFTPLDLAIGMIEQFQVSGLPADEWALYQKCIDEIYKLKTTEKMHFEHCFDAGRRHAYDLREPNFQTYFKNKYHDDWGNNTK